MQSSTDAHVQWRRLVFLTLVMGSMAGLIVLAFFALNVPGKTANSVALLFLFSLTTPWLALGFWNAIIGLVIMQTDRDPVRRPRRGAAVPSTAILMCVRNEPPERVILNLDAMLAEVEAAGCSGNFHLYVLSDTSRSDMIVAEEEAFDDLSRKWDGRFPVTYRRREANTGFKAGNIRDFLERWGDDHELMVTLDADSFMPASGMLRMIDIMQSEPRLGILQSLVIGMPTSSAFARLFQFGMRLGLRSWTIGSAWWQADCGPYWGHNAVIRVDPFKRHCAIPPLTGKGILSGHILSHDQIEAALMRRAGYEVRVLAEEELGWEENPPTLIEFIRRDRRWLRGTLQYLFFIGLPGLRIVSRVQLVLAMLMFTGSPAWVGLLLVGAVTLATGPTAGTLVNAAYGMPLLEIILTMWFAPKIATVIDVLSRPTLRIGYGGGLRFLGSVVAETIFSLLLSPIMWVCHTTSLLGLLTGRTIGWTGQVRNDHVISWSAALRELWPQTALGFASLAVVAATLPRALPYVSVLMAGGLVLSVPFCVITSWPGTGRVLKRIGIGRLPEETAPPVALRRRAATVSGAEEPASAD